MNVVSRLQQLKSYVVILLMYRFLALTCKGSASTMPLSILCRRIELCLGYRRLCV